eukprot:jgi/Mesvir1/18368/Mv14256-RA.2
MGLKVHVKWQKELFKDVEIDVSQPPLVFKTQLFTLTGVPPERQKIMVKGGLMQDDGDWGKMGIKEGQKLMMMGTADELPPEPTQPVVFVEDLPEAEQASAFLKDYRAGLLNLGNTCYMNATLQCLAAVPGLRSALEGYSENAPTQPSFESTQSHKLALATKEVFRDLATSKQPVAPFKFLMVLREKYPQFAQRGNTGGFMQQDAEECWSQLLTVLSQRLNLLGGASGSSGSSSGAASSAPAGDASGAGPMAVDGASEPALPEKSVFAIDMVHNLKCEESDEVQSSSEKIFSLKCHISADVNFLHDGLKHGLVEELEKNSPALGRSAVWKKTSRISSLPAYLTVQFVRFFWKKDTQQKAKILRPVQFPTVFDAFDFCAPELQERLSKRRKTDLEVPKGELAAAPKADTDMAAADGGAGGAAAASTSAGGKDKDKGKVAEVHPTDTGLYDLAAVLTHKGRSADSGHYVAWVKQDNGQWYKFDDDDISVVTEEEVKKLSGGGAWLCGKRVSDKECFMYLGPYIMVCRNALCDVFVVLSFIIYYIIIYYYYILWCAGMHYVIFL